MKTLYPYQQATVDKFLKQRVGLEGSDMGTGKTLVAIETADGWRQKVIAAGHGSLPILVVCPINTFSSWVEKLTEQRPSWKVHLINRKDRSKFMEDITDKETQTDVFVCHYEVLRLIVDDLKRINFSVVVADEVHKIANPSASMSKALKKIRTYFKLGLSGTACGDKPWNLFSILNWLRPDEFKNFYAFVARYAKVEVKKRRIKKLVDGVEKTVLSDYKEYSGVRNEAELHRRMRGFYVRHLKDQRCCDDHPEGVMPWLPEKTKERLYVDITGEQLRLYKEMKKNMVAWVGEHQDEPIIAPVILTKMQRLNQFTLATPVLEGEESNIVSLRLPSAKYELLKSLVSDYDTEKFVVMTSSKKMAELVATELDKVVGRVGLLTGDTKPQDRLELVSDFNNGRYRIVVASIQAAAEGIDGLQNTCNKMIFLDRHLSSFKNAQAEDRLHRNGQKNPVTIIDIVASNVEIDVETLSNIEMKWDNVMKVLNGK